MSVDIEFVWAGQEWTEEDSEALDRQILAYRARKGLELPDVPVTRRERASEDCLACGAPMRAHSSKPIPGTKVHASKGYCQNCYGKAVRHGEVATTPVGSRQARAEQARKLYQEGLEIKVIARALGCTERAVYRYTKDIRGVS